MSSEGKPPTSQPCTEFWITWPGAPSQRITTVANVVPDDDITNGLDEPPATQQQQATVRMKCYFSLGATLLFTMVEGYVFYLVLHAYVL